MNLSGAGIITRVLLLVALLLQTTSAVASNWDVTALGIDVYKYFWNGKSWEWEPTSTITAGDKIKIKCFYMLESKAAPVYPTDWYVSYFIGGSWLSRDKVGTAGNSPPKHATSTALSMHIGENLQVGLGSNPKMVLGQLDVGQQVVSCHFDSNNYLKETVTDNNRATAIVDVLKTPATPRIPKTASTPAIVTPKLVFIGAYPSFSSQSPDGTTSVSMPSGTSSLPPVNDSTDGTSSPAMSTAVQDASNSVTTGEVCALSVPYLKAESPVIETANSDLRQGDVFRIICRFTTDVKDLAWSNCDADTARMVEGYREKIVTSSAARYSGMVDVNGSTVRVAASPPQGLDAFEIEHLWVQKEPGTVVMGCKVDNILQPYVEGSGRYIEAQKSVTAGSRIEGREPMRAVDLPPRGQGAIGQRQGSSLGQPIAGGATDATRLPAVQARSVGSDTVDPTLNPQPEVPSAKQRDGTGSAVSTELPAVQGQHGGSGAVDPKLNPQPEVPSTKQRQDATGGSPGVTTLPSVQGRNGGSDAVNPTLNPQPEVPSAKQRQGVPGTSTIAERRQEGEEKLAEPSPKTALPDKVNPQRDSDQSQLTGPDNLIPPPVPPTLPSMNPAEGYAGQQTTLIKDDRLTQIQGGMPLPAGTANSGVMNPNVEPVGLPVGCALKGGGWTVAASVTITNTTRQRLEKGTPVKWTAYKKGIQLGSLVNTETEGVYYGQGVLNAALAIGQTGKVGVFSESLGSYECKASVMPSSAGGAAR